MINELPLKFWIVIASVLLHLIVLILVKMIRKGQIYRYRTYEKQMIIKGKLQLDDYIKYVKEFKFANYAAFSVSGAFIVITILLQSDFTEVEELIRLFSVILLISASMFFVYADYIHTNTLSPIIPLIKRFKLIDCSLTLSLLGVGFIMNALFFTR